MSKKIDPQVVQKAAQRIAREIEEGFTELRDNPLNWRGLKEAVEEIVPRVEAIGHEFGLPGATKKAVAIEAGIILLRRVIPSGWLSWLPDAVLRWLLSHAVELAVKKLRPQLEQIKKETRG